MNRPYVARGKAIAGVFQRCTADCPPGGCVRGHRWAYVIELPADGNGRRRQRTKGGFVTGKDAAQARAELLHEERQGLLPDDATTTVATWLRQWLVTQEEVRGLRDGTVVDYRRHVEKYWIPRIGAIKLVDLRPKHVTYALAAIKKERDTAIRAAIVRNTRYADEAAAADRARQRAGRRRPVKPMRVAVPRPFGPATARRVHGTLRAALNAAVRAQEVPRNVASLADLPRETRRRVRPWTPEQLGGWLDSILGERLYPLYHLAAFSGLRRGELCGLGWDDIDLDAAVLTVRWQVTSISYRKARHADKRGERLSCRVRPKTSDGEDRLVDLDTGTIAVLRRWHRHQAMERIEWGPGYRNRDNLVFTRTDGSPHDPHVVYETFKRLAQRCGLPDLPLHHLRHGAASLQIEAGVDIAVISKRLGHSKIALTSDTYGHLIGTVGQSAAEAAAAVVPRKRAG